MTRTVAAKDRCILCRLHCRKILTPANLPGLSEVFARLESPSILGGNSAKGDADGFSYWAAEPREVFEFRAGQKVPFEKLHRILNKYKMEDPAINCGAKHLAPQSFDPAQDRFIAGFSKGVFCGGWIGYFSYELGRYIERLPETTLDDLRMPLIRLCFYDRFIAYDHLSDAFWLVALEMPDDVEKPEHKLADLEQFLAEAERIHITQPVQADVGKIDFSRIRCNMSKDYYWAMLGRIRRYIFDGDVYQINFSQRFECDFNARPINLFHWQNYYNPSPYAAYIDAGPYYIVSASPEMFITVTPDRIGGGIIRTKPIKGTRPRANGAGKNQKINAKNFNELLHSEKEQAELNMIIDLERNDVAKICRSGTRKVVQDRTIEAYPTVYHAVATVEGRLRQEITFCDILKAMFPGGSITGAPKIHSMEIIDETEPTARGVYTGSIGYIGIDGSVCLNIAIRTIIITGQEAFAQTGGGIVADSEPQAEWDETITKAGALLAGIASVTRHTLEKTPRKTWG